MRNWRDEILYLMANLSFAYEEAIEKLEKETDPQNREYLRGKADGLFWAKYFSKDAYEGWYERVKAMNNGLGPGKESPVFREREDFMNRLKEEEARFLQELKRVNREWSSGLSKSDVAGMSDEEVRLQYLRLVMGEGLESELEKRTQDGKNEKS